MNGGIPMGLGIACYSNGQASLVTYPKEPTMQDDIRRIEQKLDEVLKIMKSLPTTPGEFKKKTVDDADLDGKYGNPEVRMIPSKWNGPDYKGWKFSDCPPEFLDELAGMLDAIARKQAQDPAKAKFSDWSAKDAARARAWAERQRKQMLNNASFSSKSNPFDIDDGHSLEDRHNDDMDIPF